MEDLEKKAYAYAIKNAVAHEGKAMQGPVISSLFNEGLKPSEVGKFAKKISEIIMKVNALPLEEQEKEFEKLKDNLSEREVREGLEELPNAKEGKVVLRLAPFPSGALHIGNAKTYLLNALYAEKYKGKLLFVIDDTIGSEEKQIMKEAYKLIPEAFDWLKVKYEKPILYKSDRLEIYYKYAEELIKKGKAYVCLCPTEKLRENRLKGIECEHRKQTPKKALEEWKKMLTEYKPMQASLRLKTSMKAPDPAFRDRVLFRISERPHPRVGKKYRVWPLLEFSWAIDDHLLKITHIIRGKDLMIESEMEKYIWDIFGWKYPELLHAGMVKVEGMGAKISKSKSQKEIQSGEFSGWDDPRTWSVQSLKKRGFQPEVLKKFVENIGLNQNDIKVPVDVLYALNRKVISEIAKPADFEENVKGKIKIIKEDGTALLGNSGMNFKDEEIVFFRGVGYCKYDKKVNLFYFAHN
jgi:glutamyl-tRNA synthetase